MKELTEKQQKVLDFMKRSIESNGYPPSVREIGEHFEISLKGAYDHLMAIKRKGYVEIKSNKSRAIRIVK